jgi:heat-inducible transcriptional repressor
MMLTERQKTILHLVSQRFIHTGEPVSSKAVAAAAEFKVSPSTVRNEFAVLEETGYLTHPHTSAGRTPTDRGYREFVDYLLGTHSRHDVCVQPIPAEDLGVEVDTALQQTSEAMSKATNLLALVVAPLVSGARIRHIELLRLQPNLVMVVFIISTGSVTKETIDYAQPIDLGVLAWARTYLNELVEDRLVSERLVRRTLDNPELGPKESSFLRSLAPAFERLLDEQSSEALYVGGASRLFADGSFQDVAELRELLKLLEERYQLLRLLRSALSRDRVLVSIGQENPSEALRPFSLVAAGYGLPQRNLGTVSLLGPTRMDYETAILTVRGTAQMLSSFLEDRYE